MKANGTRIILIVFFFYILLVMFSFSSYAQPDYDFTSGSLFSGTANQIGAKYRYTNVKPGVDAIITITDISAGIKVVDLDAGSGYPEALQPTIDIPAGTKGYLEMKFEFVVAGTSTPMVQLEIPATCIDVDGTNTLHEYDEISIGAGAYVDFNQLGGDLAISFKTGWTVGTNIGTVTYPGRDTTAREAMFSVINANQSEISIRVGADNLGGSTQQRLRSVYFKKFNYANSYLAQPALMAFRGIEKNKKVELNWDLVTDHHLAKIIVEKSSTSGNYKPLAEFWINEGANQLAFRYADNEQLSATTYYRLKMISANGFVQYSNILAFRSATGNQHTFKVYPSVVYSNAILSMRAEKAGTAVFNLVDMSGRIVFQQYISMQEGTNNILVNGFDKLTSGNYIALVRNGKEVVQQKISKQ